MGRTVIESYPHQLGGHCGSGALRDLLPWAGLGWGSLPGDGLPGEGLVFGMEGTGSAAMAEPMDIRAVGEATQLLPACERALERAGKSV